MSDDKRVFVIWDQTIPNLASNLDGLRIHPLLEGKLHALGLDPAQGYVLDRIQAALAKATGAIAVLDQHNANVGFEIGLALGSRLPVALVAAAQVGVGWTSKAPFAGHLVPKTAVGPRNLRTLLDQLDQEGREAWNVVDGAVEVGSEALLLWPEDQRGEIFEGAIPELPARRLPVDGWTIKDLPAKLRGVGKVVWVVLQPNPNQRDGEENARLAVIAGFARAVNLQLVILVEKPAENVPGRTLVDIQGLSTGWSTALELKSLLTRELSTAQPATRADPLETYRAALRAKHAELIPFAEGMTETVLQQVVIELGLQACDGREGWRTDTPTLHELLGQLSQGGAGGASAPSCGRLVVRAEPGAGKTTAARHVAFVAASDPQRVPVLVPLVELGAHDPFVWTARAFDDPDLRAALDAAAKVAGRVWLLLDGLDELSEPARHDLLPRLKQMATDPRWRQVVIVVLGRDVAFQHSQAFAGWQMARLRPLTDAQQVELIGRLVPEAERAAALRQHIQRWPTLGQLAQNPLLLTLYAVVGRAALAERAAVPYTRPDLYGKAVNLLLRGAHRAHPAPVVSASASRRLLGALAVELHERGGEAWDKDTVVDAIRAAYTLDPEAEKQITGAYGTNSPERVLADLDTNGGLFGRLDGVGDTWRFQHRSLREFLVAEGLGRAPARLEAFEARWVEAVANASRLREKDRAAADAAGAEAARAGEVMGLRASLDRGPKERLEGLASRNPDALVRLLRTTEGLGPAEVIRLFFSLKLRSLSGGDWDGDDLVPALLAAADGQGAVAQALWGEVRPGRSLTELGLLWDALVRTGARGDPREALQVPVFREQFFDKAEIPPPDPARLRVLRVALGTRLPSTAARAGAMDLTFVELPGGSFRMGSPEGEGDEDERPQHGVTVGPFAIGQTAVTRAAWAVFTRTNVGASRAELPVADVDWYGATLFAAWLGGRLPTEAEWEYACRAGTKGAWSCAPRVLTQHAWFDENSMGNVHKVADSLPNPWGLYDMHGNVWEWCADGLRTYDAVDQTNPVGPSDGVRVVRGGSVRNSAGRCRSACRGRNWPRNHWNDQGLRVLLPSPAREP